jgi:transcriptional regulator with XRE-family HTH domain
MTKAQKAHVIGDAPPTAIKQLSKQEFARRLYTRMSDKNLIQADLARLTGLSRNNISTYIRGASFPTRESLVKLAKALDCSTDELLPNFRQGAIQNEQQPDISMQASVADPGRSWLVINRLVSTSAAIQILKIIDDDRRANA